MLCSSQNFHNHNICDSISHSIITDSLQACGLSPTRPLCPWDSPGKNIGVGCHFLLQGTFPTQRSNLGLPHCRQMLYCLSYQGSLEYQVVECIKGVGQVTIPTEFKQEGSVCVLSHIQLCDPWTVARSGKNARVGYHFLPQRIFPGQGSDSQLLPLLYWCMDSLPLSHLGSPREVRQAHTHKNKSEKVSPN